MEIFDAKSFINSEIVIQEFRNHVRTSDDNLQQLLHDIAEMIIELYSNDKSISLKEMRDEILKKINSDGILEDFLNSTIRDMYNQYFAICKNESRKRIGLKFAIYQGGLRDDSRQFCKERNRNCYSEEEIEQWKYLDFQGKPENYNPFYDFGGINCAHRLDWISDELAEIKRPDLF
jgi:hypothetical protein